MATVVAKKRSFIDRLISKSKRELFKASYQLFCKFPINHDKISILSDSRKDLSDNFIFIYKQLEAHYNYEYFFLLKKGVTANKSYIEILKLSFNAATSKVILVDDYYPLLYGLNIRKNADFIQIWHAVGAFKTFGYSRLGKPGGPKQDSTDHRNYTKAIVSSTAVAPFYAEGFGIDIEKIIPTGVPRTDIFFDDQYINRKKEEMYKQFPAFKNKKLVLYAPTFRGNGQSIAHFPMEHIDLESIGSQLDEDTLFLIKLHPFVDKQINIPIEYKDKIMDFSTYPSINHLLFMADLLITDYSSVCFEFALLERPMIFYCFDLEEYITSRDFYIPYQSFTPGPIVKTCDEMIKRIPEYLHVDKVDYSDFTSKFFDHMDGKSTQRVADLINSCMSKR